jgi:hypothetical protein
MPQEPNHALGWLYLTSDNRLHAPAPYMEPFPNVLWVFRTPEKGLRLAHAGPLKRGDYAYVAHDRTMTYVNDEKRDPGRKQNRCKWPFVDENGAPCLFVEPLTLTFCNTAERVVRVYPDDTIGFDEPLIVD